MCVWLSSTACGVLVPLPGMEPGPRGVEAWGLHRSATREVAECALTRIVSISAACCEVLSAYRWHYVCVI